MGNNTSSGRNGDMKRALELSVSVVTLASAAYFMYTIHDTISKYASQEESFDREKKELARKLKRPDIESIAFSKHEISIALDVVCPDDLNTSFSDIGGMENEIETIRDNVILPFNFWKEERVRALHDSGENITESREGAVECHVPGGMLIYGRPGTGKSMLAKAIAKEAQTSFIGVKSGTILDKYVGESDKLVAAIFSLAQKIAPTVVFIDEVDTLLKKRESLQSGSSSNISSMLGTLMSEWDGLNSDGKAPVIVLGATNRPMDIDSAFLRRMPLTIQTQAPDLNSRVDILRKMLKNENLADDVNLDLIAASIEGFTGSEIREICRLASISRMKAILQAKKKGREKSEIESGRALTQEDFEHALTKIFHEGGRQVDYKNDLSFDEARDKIDMATNWIKRAMAQNKSNPDVRSDAE